MIVCELCVYLENFYPGLSNLKLELRFGRIWKKIFR